MELRATGQAAAFSEPPSGTMVPNMPYIIQSPLIDIKRVNEADNAMNRLVWRLAGGFIASGIAIPLVQPACERYPPLGAGLVIIFAAYIIGCSVHGTRTVRSSGWTVMQIRDALVYRPALWVSIGIMIILAVAISKLFGNTPVQASRDGGHNNLMSVGFDEYFQAVAGMVRPGGMQPKAE